MQVVDDDVNGVIALAFMPIAHVHADREDDPAGLVEPVGHVVHVVPFRY